MVRHSWVWSQKRVWVVRKYARRTSVAPPKNPVIDAHEYLIWGKQKGYIEVLSQFMTSLFMKIGRRLITIRTGQKVFRKAPHETEGVLDMFQSPGQCLSYFKKWAFKKLCAISVHQYSQQQYSQSLKSWKQLKASIDGWMDKHSVLYAYNRKAFKRMEILTHARTWMNLEEIILDEISQSQKDKYCTIPLTWST